MEEKINLYKNAIDKWGTTSQMDMAIEECAELIKAINKFKRNQSAQTVNDLCSEIADVEIMMEQMRVVMRKDGLIDKIKEEKLERLKNLLSK